MQVVSSLNSSSFLIQAKHSEVFNLATVRTACFAERPILINGLAPAVFLKNLAKQRGHGTRLGHVFATLFGAAAVLSRRYSSGLLNLLALVNQILFEVRLTCSNKMFIFPSDEDNLHQRT